MLILSHRGYWKNKNEKNTLKAFAQSFALGFGTELDVRDDRSQLVVSHDIPKGKPLDFRKVLDLRAKYKTSCYLAINIKSDGLQESLKDLLDQYDVKHYFVFDMSVPDALGYLNAGIKMFTRQSEYEQVPSLYSKAAGVWMDEFRRHWISADQIRNHVCRGKKVCIVSPELHYRRHLPIWKEYRKVVREADTDQIMICTDIPEEARRFFYG